MDYDELKRIKASIRQELEWAEQTLADRQRNADAYAATNPTLAREFNESRLYWKGRYEALYRVAQVAKVRA